MELNTLFAFKCYKQLAPMEPEANIGNMTTLPGAICLEK